MDDHIQLVEGALQPHSVLEVYHHDTAVCVEGYQLIGATRLNQGIIDSYYVEGANLMACFSVG